MVPENLDDGFTVEVAEGVFCRPMLWQQKQTWKRDALVNHHRAKRLVMTEPYRFGEGEPAGHEIKVIQFVLGYGKTEDLDYQELNDAVSLQSLNPGLSELDCNDCRRYSVDHSTGTIQLQPDGQPKVIPGGISVPCETSQGCLKGHHTHPGGLSNPRWAKTWRHWWDTRTAGNNRLALCPIFRRNSMLLNWIVNYGRDRRFDPFAGRSTSRGTSVEPSEGTAGPDSNREGCSGGGCASGACGTGCQTETEAAGLDPAVPAYIGGHRTRTFC